MTPEELKHAVQEIEMDEGMYARILTVKKPRRPWMLQAAVILCSTVILAVVFLFGWSVRYQLRYRAFVKDLSSSITYAYAHDSLQADVDGELIRVSDENMYKIYNYILQGGSGRERRKLPQEDCAAALYFGNGSTLRLWTVASQGYQPPREKSLLLCFEDRGGEVYLYANANLTLETFTANYLYLGNNEPWETE